MLQFLASFQFDFKIQKSKNDFILRVATCDELLNFGTLTAVEKGLLFKANYVKISEWIMTRPWKKCQSKTLLFFELPPPGMKLDFNFIRIIYISNFILIARQKLGQEVESRSLLQPSPDSAILILAWKTLAVKPETNIDLYKLAREFEVEFSEEEIKFVWRDLKEQDPSTLQIWDEILSIWQMGYQELFSKHGISLSVTKPLAFSKSKMETISGNLSNIPAVDQVICNFALANEFYYKKSISQLTNPELISLNPIHLTRSNSNDLHLLDSFLGSAYEKLNQSVVECKKEITWNLAKAQSIMSLLTCRICKPIDIHTCSSNELGIHIQYSHARLAGIKRWLIQQDLLLEFEKTSTIDFSLCESTPRIYQLIELIHEYPMVLEKAALGEPCIIVNYAANLSKSVSSLYYHLRIKGEKYSIQLLRWKVFEKCQMILDDCITLCGVDPINEV
jgi:hypothetical protein